MKAKFLAAALLAAFGISSASADTLDPVQITGTSFANQLIGSISISSLSNITGSLFAADKVGTPWGFWSLSSVTFSGGSLGSYTFGSKDFSFSSVSPGTYQLTASGSLGSDGQIKGIGFVGANYTVTAVPEPEGFAMLLAGLGVIGSIALRRKKH